MEEEEEQQHQHHYPIITHINNENHSQQQEECITNTTKSNSNSSPSYVLGLFFIFAVSVIWSASSVLVQYIYEQNGTSSNSNNNNNTNESSSSLTPFLVTYIGVSLFSIFLPAQWFYQTIQRIICLNRSMINKPNKHNHNNIHHPYDSIPTALVSTTTPTRRIPSASSSSSSSLSLQVIDESQDDMELNELSESSNGTTTTCTEPIVPSPPPMSLVWTRRQYIITALQIAPVWFGANWAYNGSLLFTSITSSTVLASTSSLFTFLFAYLLQDEDFTVLKLGGVILGVTGSILTALNDNTHPTIPTNTTTTMNTTTTSSTTTELLGVDYNNRILLGLDTIDTTSSSTNLGMTSSMDHPTSHITTTTTNVALGDFLGIVAAIGYAGYAVQTRVLCPKDESLYQMHLVLGYIGCICMIGLSPIAIYELYFTGHTGLGWGTFIALVIKGLMDNVLSDYLWLRAVILTSATVATVGLGLTIPLAFISDIAKGNGQSVFRMNSLLGATSVLIGFLLVNLGNLDDDSVVVVDIDDNNENDDTEDIIIDDASPSNSRMMIHHPDTMSSDTVTHPTIIPQPDTRTYTTTTTNPSSILLVHPIMSSYGRGCDESSESYNTEDDNSERCLLSQSRRPPS